jgi:hypothetical protein
MGPIARATAGIAMKTIPGEAANHEIRRLRLALYVLSSSFARYYRASTWHKRLFTHSTSVLTFWFAIFPITHSFIKSCMRRRRRRMCIVRLAPRDGCFPPILRTKLASHLRRSSIGLSTYASRRDEVDDVSCCYLSSLRDVTPDAVPTP